MKVIIIGGGWAGCAASIIAKKTGCKSFFSRKDRYVTGIG